MSANPYNFDWVKSAGRFSALGNLVRKLRPVTTAPVTSQARSGLTIDNVMPGIASAVKGTSGTAARSATDAVTGVQRLGRRWANVPQGRTFTQHIKDKPFTNSWRAAWGPMLDHKKKTLAGLIGTQFAEPVGATAGHLANVNDLVYNTLRNPHQRAFGEDLDRSAYNSFRNRTLFNTLRNVITGKVPEDPASELGVQLTRAYGMPAGKEFARRVLSDTGATNPFGNWKNIYNPKLSLLTKNPVAKGVRGWLSDRIFRARDASAIGVEGTERLYEAYKERPERFAQAIDRFNDEDYAQRAYRGWDNKHVFKPLASSLLQQQLLSNANPLDYAATASRGLIGGDILNKPAEHRARQNQMLVDQARREGWFNKGKVNFTKGDQTPNLGHHINFETGNVSLGMPDNLVSPGTTAHELGHAYAYDSRLPALNKAHMASRALSNITSGVAHSGRGNALGLGLGEPGNNANTAAAIIHALTASPMVAAELMDSYHGARLAGRALQGDDISDLDRLRAQVGAFNGTPTYIQNAYAPLWEQAQARRHQD